MKSVAVLMLHVGCDLACPFCVNDPAPCLRFQEAEGHLRRLGAEGVSNVVLGGGEPFLWPHDVTALARAAKGLGFFVQVGTNGTRLPDAFERLSCFDRWVLPLESDAPPVHDLMRPGAGPSSHHAVILDRLERLRAAGRSVTVSTVVTSWNVGGLPRLAAFLEGYRDGGGNLHAWHLYRFLPRGRGGSVNARDLWIDAAAYHRACDAVRGRHPDLAILKRPDMYRSQTVSFHGAGLGAPALTGK